MSQKINYKLRNKEWRPARQRRRVHDAVPVLVINFLLNNQPRKTKVNVVMDRAHSLTILVSTLSTGLIGLVTLSGYAYGVTVLQPCVKNKNSCQVRV